ncbi:MAG: flippase-like domain-containing protein [bacterium]|nr:flippase-like domain-containing protein [bacterium]
MVAAAAAAVVLYAVRWGMLLAGLGTPVGLGRLTALRAAGQSVSAILPTARLGGDPLRVWLLARSEVPVPPAIASVAVDRALEMGSGAAFAVLFGTILVQHGLPALSGIVASLGFGLVALAVGLWVTSRRLGRGDGLVTALARATGLGRLRALRGGLDVMEGAEHAAAGLLAQPRRVRRAFLAGVAANLVTPLEYWLLLSAFGLPADGVAVVAAIFAAGAAHAMPVPAGIGVLEGGQMWLFGLLGHPPEVGLAVGLAVRLRELVWVVPGLVVLAGMAWWLPRAPEAGAYGLAGADGRSAR